MAAACCVSAAPAQAALSRAQQASRAAAQASYQCSTHNCRSRRVLAFSPAAAGAVVYHYRYAAVRGVPGRALYAHCDQLLKVTAGGSVVQSRLYNCA